MGAAMTSSSLLLQLACLVLTAAGQPTGDPRFDQFVGNDEFVNTNPELPECRDGDVKCYTVHGHVLYDDRKYQEGCEWFEKAGNYSPALDALAFACETGQGKPKDPSKAFKLYRDAAH